ncbi:MAG: CusA/CzcA family heavy metal efflux RND transporter [Deltaproteobacteria bacterium]
MNRLVARLIEACARAPWTTLLFVAALLVWAGYAIRDTKLDAIPDLSDTQVIILTEWPGRSPDLVEDQITYPLSSSLLGAPKVKFVRGQSFFGLSFVYVVFEDGTDLYWARSRIVEYMAGAALPDGVTPKLGPDATGVGWVFQYALVDRSGEHDLAALRSLQDFDVRYALQSVPGVAEVASVGGFVKQYQVTLDPVRLQAFGVSVPTVVKAVRASNADVGGRTVEIAGHEHMIRGRGYVKTTEDLEAVVVKTGEDGTPVTIGELGRVVIGPDQRRGVAELNGEGEVVGGIVVMRYGENALATIDRVKARLESVRAGLPDGVELEVVYDRSELIERAIDTLATTLLEEMLVVAIVIFLFLLSLRSAVIPIVTLPVAVALAFIPMAAQGLTANIMSLGGIAVAIGAMVDASIIIIENVHTTLEGRELEGEARRAAVIRAMQEVGPSIFFSLLVITVSFIPVFTLQATEGRLFKPLAFTKTYAMGFAALMAVTLTPALVVLLVRRAKSASRLEHLLVALYRPVVRFVVRHRFAVVIVAVLIVATTVPVFARIGSEFMPPLDEGALLYMPTSPPGMSITEAANVVRSMNRELKKVPEVVSVFGKMGRAETATDPAPLSMAETVIVLKPREAWRPGLTTDALIDELDERMRYPGMPNVWWMPIQTRTEMLSTGVRSPIGIQIFGDDLKTIEDAAVRVEKAVAEIEGTRSAFAERSTGGFFVDFEVRRRDAARYGLSVEDVNTIVTSAIGGMNVSQIVDGRERYPVNVRYARDFRDTPDALEEVLVTTPSGAHIPISQVADVHFRTGPPMIRSEAGALVGFVFVDPGDVPLQDYVERAQAVVAGLDLPAGVRVGWAGQFSHLERAKAQLTLVLPLTLFLVVLLLYWNTGSLTETAIVLLAVPFSLVGAVWLLFGLGYNLSVAVWVGLIALAGLDAETGVVMLLYLKLAYRDRQDGEPLVDVIERGAAHRVRPKLMTVLTGIVGLVPILWSTGTGSDVMRRIAAPMVGGLVTSFLLELTVYPALFAIWKGRATASTPNRSGSDAPAP